MTEFQSPETRLGRIKEALRDIGFTDTDYIDGPAGYAGVDSVVLTASGAAKANEKILWIKKAGLQLYSSGSVGSIAFPQKKRRRRKK